MAHIYDVLSSGSRDALREAWIDRAHADLGLSVAELDELWPSFEPMLDHLARLLADPADQDRAEALRQRVLSLSQALAAQGHTMPEILTMVFGIDAAALDTLHAPDDDEIKTLKEWFSWTRRMAAWLTEVRIERLDEVIQAQREELEELQSPIIQVWDGVIAVPLVGTLDSSRAELVTESLLLGIEAHRADYAILDITGVSAVDSLVAERLLRAAAAVRLMGATCVISGLGARIAQTIVQLGIELPGIRTTTTLAAALQAVLRDRGRSDRGLDG